MTFHSNMYGIIYKTTCLANGKIYVGQTTSSDPSYLGSGIKLRCAFKRYGRKKFKRETLKECDNQKQLDAWELVLIKKLRATDPKIGYNQLPGPTRLLNPSKLPEVKKIKSQKLSGKNNPMYGRRGELHPNYGKKRTPEQIAKISGKNNPMFGKTSPFKGKHLSEEARKTLSEKAKARLKNKENHPNYNNKWSDEQKRLQSQKLKDYYNWLYS